MLIEYPEILSELNMVEEFIKKSVVSRNKLLLDVVKELIEAGGKRLRPAMVIISSKFGICNQSKVISLAGALELLHTATLVHDDVIDRSGLRRGKVTISEKFGTDLAVYTGDFLFAKSVMMLSRDISIAKLDMVASAVKTICEGEVDQYQDRFNTDTSILSYFKRVNKKTAILFGAACGLGAYAADCPEDITKKLSRFGFYYGMAFQIRDDINDYLSKESREGKPVGKDLAEGIITLPAIYGIGKSNELRKVIQKAFSGRNFVSVADVAEIVEMVKACGGVEVTKTVLGKYIKKGIKILDGLPENSYKKLLKEMISKLQI